MAKHSVRSPVGGSVWIHTAAVGQTVFEGSPLLTIEVMKTEFPIESPCAGTVTYLAAVGQTLDQDALVAIVDDAKS